jgi:hypothetical protein
MAERNIVDPLCEFLNDKKERFPLLTNIVIGIPHFPGDKQKKAEEYLRASYRETVIQPHILHPGDLADGVDAFLRDN